MKIFTRLRSRSRDLDDFVEIGFLVTPADFDFAFDELVIRGIDVVVQGRGDLLYLERCQKAVVDAFLEGIDIDRIAEIFVSVDVVLALGSCGEPKLYGGREISEDVAPSAFVVCAAAMAFINDDEIEEIGRIFAEIWGGFSVFRRAAHKSLENREEKAAIFWDAAFLSNVVRIDAHECVFGECGKGVVSLIGQDIAVGEK